MSQYKKDLEAYFALVKEYKTLGEVDRDALRVQDLRVKDESPGKGSVSLIA